MFYAAGILEKDIGEILEMFEYLRSNGFPLPTGEFDSIARNGKLKLIEWLVENDYKGKDAIHYLERSFYIYDVGIEQYYHFASLSEMQESLEYLRANESKWKILDSEEI